jgi:polysaccharide biosynthesis transport protein
VIAGNTSIADALRAALAGITDGTGSQRPGYARPPREALGRPPFDNAFVDRCRTALVKLAGADEGGLVAVTSAKRKDGRSSVAAALATALARTRGLGGVLLADLDFERPFQADLFSVAPSPGLADFLEGRERLRLVFGGPGRQLALMPAGMRLGDPALLFHQLTQDGLLSVFRERFQWVVVDLPPLDTNPEVAQLLNQANWHIIVGWHRRSTVEQLRGVQEQLLAKNRAGFLLTGDSTRIPGWIRRLF